jgi:hypothetical protein
LTEHVGQVVASLFVEKGKAVRIADRVLEFADRARHLFCLDNRLPDAAAMPSLVTKARTHKLFLETSLLYFFEALIFIQISSKKITLDVF